MAWSKSPYPPSLLEAAAIHSFLHTLGYSLADEVFICFSPRSVGVELRVNGKNYMFRVGAPELSPEQMAELWLRLASEWNRGGVMTKADKDAVCRTSKVFVNRDKTILAMITNGLSRWTEQPPDWPNCLN